MRSRWIIRIAVMIALSIGLVALLNTLVPAWDYDGLMYHLTGPRAFLEQGGIFPNQEIWYVNGPFSIEMLFTLGLAFGDVLTPKLLHLLFGSLYVLSTWSFSRRWLGSRSAWIAFAILLGMPTLPIWSGFAYIDMAWSLLEWLALAAAVEYFRTRDGGWLTMSAVFLGLALGTKYLALMGLIVIAILYAWDARRKPPAAIASDALRVGLILIGIAGFWYLKNWVWFKNPVYPLYFGGPGWSTERLTLYNDYLKSFGTGLSLASLVSMPVTIYTRHALFGAVMNRNDILSPLFILAWLYPFTRRRQETNILVAAIVFRVGLWVIGSQQIRFLLPIDPAIAILCAYVIANSETRLVSWPSLKLFLPSLAVGLMLITLFYQVQLARQLRPWDVIIGLESADEFLNRNVGDFGAAHFIQDELPDTARVLLLGDGRSYYCSPKCIPDPDHFRWAALISSSNNPTELPDRMGGPEITHFMISLEDLDFLLQHDPSGILSEATDQIVEWKSSGELIDIYSDDLTRIMYLTENGG